MVKFEKVEKKEQLKEGDYVIAGSTGCTYKVDCLDGDYGWFLRFDKIKNSNMRGDKFDISTTIERDDLYKIISE